MGIESNKEAYQTMKNSIGSMENRMREIYNKGYRDGIKEGINRAMQKIADSILEEVEADRKTEPQIDGAIDEVRFKAHCMNCQRDVADIKCLDCDGDKYFIPDEPQTDCSWR